jgi:hypothetical protein
MTIHLSITFEGFYFILLSSFYWCGNRGTERVNNLPKITQLLSVRTGIWKRQTGSKG